MTSDTLKTNLPTHDRELYAVSSPSGSPSDR
jgi:hypothetical protein